MTFFTVCLPAVFAVVSVMVACMALGYACGLAAAANSYDIENEKK